MDASPGDVAKTLAHIAETIQGPEHWVKWPGGWPGDIESALVDAVFSARAVYDSERGRGILAQVRRWQATRDRTVFSLQALLSEIDPREPLVWAQRFGNQQHSPGRRVTAPGGQSKAAAVREAAAALTGIGISVAADITTTNTAAVKAELCRIEGLGYATTNYFLVLLGAPGVKPDTMIHRFLKDAAGHAFTDPQAEATLDSVAHDLGVPAHELDHAIWAYERERKASD
ncbi:MAG TPA: hypothetical protein VKY26_00860 [Actinomycetota bacterium]|nr:hypothetical protein [Actinomycetota bacterium]